MTALEALQLCPLFKDFTETGLKIFATIAQEKVVPAGIPLFVESSIGDTLYIVKSGTVRLTQKGAEGERELGIVGAGEPLGALGLLAKTVRLVTATAQTQCEVLELSQRDFTRLQPQKPQACLKLAVAIAADLAAKVAESRDLVRELARKPGGA